MSRGPGLTGDKNFRHSTEYYRKGSDARYIAYGKTREEIVAGLESIHHTSDWEDSWVVMPTKTVALGLPPTWARVARRYDEYGERVY